MTSPDPVPKSQAGTAAGARARAWLAANRRVLAWGLGLFSLGLLLGWLGLARWSPPPGTGATPTDLAPEWRDTFVQLVADAYVQENAAARARLRLQSFDDAALRAELQRLYEQPTNTALGRYSIGELARALSITVTEPSTLTVTTAHGAEGTGLSPGGVVILVGAILLLVAGGVLLYRGLSSRRPWVRPALGNPVPHGVPVRLTLGDTITTHYHASVDPFKQSFLIHDERGGLVGNVAIQSQRVGSVNTLDMWLYEREEEGGEDERGEIKAPLVTFAAQAAVADSVFSARLSDRRVVVATPGAQAVLETTHLVVNTRVRNVEPDPAADELIMQSLTLSLTPDRLAEVTPTVDTEPPVPLRFQPD